MGYWLFKEEPSNYSFADLERDGSVVWEGVANPQAKKNLASAQVGDRAFYYHTGGEKAVVGVVEVVAAGDTPTVKPVRRLATPVTLAAVKADPAFADWPLVRQPRLSVMAVPAALWAKIEAMGQ